MNVLTTKTETGYVFDLVDGTTVIATQCLDYFDGAWIAHSHASIDGANFSLLYRAIIKTLRTEGASHYFFSERYDSPMRQVAERHKATPVNVLYMKEVI